MKFSSSLKFNAVSDWWEEYIAYDTLKKYIYQLEKQQQQHHLVEPIYRDRDLEASEHSALLSPGGGYDVSSTDAVFIPLLDHELRKIEAFYESQEKELFDELNELEESARIQEDAGLMGVDGRYEDEEDDMSDDDSIGDSRSPTSPVGRRKRSLSSKQLRRKSTSNSGGTAGRQRGNTFSGPSGGRASTTTDPASSPEVQLRRFSVSSFEEPHDTPEQTTQTQTLQNSISSLPHAQQPKGTLGRITSKFTHTLFDSLTSHSGGDGQGGSNIWQSSSDYATDTRLLYKRRITNLYISFTNLKSYVEVNYSGFRKIIKKYDKVTYSELKDRYLHDVVERSPPFLPTSKSKLNDGILSLIDLYAKCVTRNDKAIAKTQLRMHQRENVAWERDTVWRQMIGRERRGVGGMGETGGVTLVKETVEEKALVKVGRVKITGRMMNILVALAGLVLFLNVRVVRSGSDEANRCFAVLVFCTTLWATEAIPLFVTSLFVPMLLVLLRIVRYDTGEHVGQPMSPPDATKYVFSIMFSPTIMLLIGGFTISSALSKTNIDRVIITRVLSLAGTKPHIVLLAFMCVSCFASMWISNVAAPTLCYTLIQPILRTLPTRSAFGPCLILAIALAANIGGQSSPISSPQNLIALEAMNGEVDWAQWFIVALPVSAISIVLIWLLLLASYRPARSPDGEGEIEIKAIRPTREAFTAKQYWVTFVCMITIALWCIAHTIERYVGDMGIIALFPIIAFFSTGVLKKDDFEHFAWTIVFLAMGGIALGKGVISSGLLDVLGSIIPRLVADYTLYSVVLILSPIILIISTFISHTIASVLLVPIAREVGSSLPGQPRNLLIFITALICSAGMGMPVSGFPNQTAATQEDELGELYLSNIDFLKNGVPASIIATIVVSTVGFLLMKLIGL